MRVSSHSAMSGDIEGVDRVPVRVVSVEGGGNLLVPAAYRDAAVALAGHGIIAAEDVNPTSCLLLAEAVNWAAKMIGPWFYRFKTGLVALALELGATGGWRDGIFYLYTAQAGVASFHDPGGELFSIVGEMEWEYPWSGVPRQEMAWELMESYVSGDGCLLELYSNLTAPGNVVECEEEEEELSQEDVEYALELCA